MSPPFTLGRRLLCPSGESPRSGPGDQGVEAQSRDQDCLRRAHRAQPEGVSLVREDRLGRWAAAPAATPSPSLTEAKARCGCSARSQAVEARQSEIATGGRRPRGAGGFLQPDRGLHEPPAHDANQPVPRRSLHLLCLAKTPSGCSARPYPSRALQLPVSWPDGLSVLLRRWSGWKDSVILVKPGTVIAWHRRSFRPSGAEGLQRAARRHAPRSGVLSG